ncbi:hypothetical protein PIROE2DRAFT_40807 [Piromyces sp. E2]|nr:hypothetical protein PIROE2DRAFT_40807 [Piromyces sp. E2]|eukprot:OUM66424.1 hypothetical protein PIROE2DRAFT_40807 [Piromyces sp. E2]
MSVTLSSSDNQVFTVDKEIAEKSVLLHNMLEDVGESDNVIPLPNVTGDILKKVIEYCEYHRNDPVETEEELDDISRSNTGIGNWDMKYLEGIESNEVLFDITLAANYMDIKPLLNLTCKHIANMIRGKKPEEIRAIFNIENDFTPEEEEQIKRENEWASEC